ncbi:MAG: hypothetical protein KAY24_10715, partial [Candidatus Eisenbacteria sp.]|nr:hypothetical protein [Candidatus Eisenbacteria bacterium]
ALLAATRKEDNHREVRNLWLGYCALAWVGAGAEALLLTPQPAITSAAPGLYTATFPRASRAGLALRSALVPGAGQRYMGRGGWGSFFFSVTGALAAGALVAHDDYLDARRDQAVAQSRFDEAEAEDELADARRDLEAAADDADEKNVIRWALVGGAAGVYLWNVLDAFGQDCEPMVPGVVFSLIPAPDGASLCVSWRIP